MKSTPRSHPKSSLLGTRSRLMKLEPRILFDGSLGADAYNAAATSDTDSDTQSEQSQITQDESTEVQEPVAVTETESAESADNFVVDTAVNVSSDDVAEVNQRLTQFIASATDEQLFALFNGGNSEMSAQWQAQLQQLRDTIAADAWNLSVIAMDSTDTFTAIAAFSAQGPDEQPTIFVNNYWFSMFGSADVQQALLEEAGHAIDYYLNGSSDTAGDEGRLFSAAVLGGEQTQWNTERETGIVTVAGEEYAVEFATFTFVNAYQMVDDINQDGVVQNTESWAEKEQNIHYLIPVSLGSVTVTDGTGNLRFSGNDVSAVALDIAGTDYYGWISRPVKETGSVVAFYFWTDSNFSDLSAAQADGNQDGDSNVKDNTGFILVVNQAAFDSAMSTISKTYTVADPLTGTSTTYSTYLSIGSSSDRVNSALNSLISDITLKPDYNTIDEDAVATGNLLTNDSITGGTGSITVQSFTISGMSGTFTTSAAVDVRDGSNNLIGSITIDANGDYTFTPIADWNGTVPTINYTVTDGSGTTATSTLKLVVLPVAEAPVANADTNTALEASGVNNGTAGLNPQGNVLTGVITTTAGSNTDSTADSADSTLTLISVENSAEGSGPMVVNSSGTTTITGVYGELVIQADGTYTYNVSNSNTSIDAMLAGDSKTDTFSYTVRDADGALASASLSILILGANDTPVAVDDYNIAKESLLSDGNQYTGSDSVGVKATGDVTTNDTDVDHAESDKSIVGLTETGSAVAGAFSAADSSVALTFITSTNINSVSVGATTYAFWDYDSNSSTKAGALASESSGSYTFISVTSKEADPNNAGQTIIGLSAIPTHYYNGTTWVAFSDVESQLQGTFAFGSANGNEAANSAKDGVLVTDGASVNQLISLSSYSGSVYVGMTVSAVDGSNVSVLPSGTTVTDIQYDGSGNIATIALSNNFTNGTSDPTGYTLSFSIPAGAATVTTAYGTLVINADGSYVYTPIENNSLLSEGESYLEAFDYTMQDSVGAQSSATLYITVLGSGSNDPSAGNLTITAQEAGGTANATAGLDPQGNASPDRLTDQVTTNGSFPNKYITQIDSVATGQSATPTTTLLGDGSTNAAVVVGKYGTLTVNADGTYRYQVNNDLTVIEALRDSSDTLSETFNYRVENYSSDNNTLGGTDFATITVTIQGQNDAPIAKNDAGVALETGSSAGTNATGNVLTNDSDIDGTTRTVTSIRLGGVENSGSSGTVDGVTALVGNYGSLTISANGDYTYVIDNNNALVNALTSGQTLTESFNYTVTDEGALTDVALLTITIRGANDAPIANNNSYQVTEDMALTGKNIINDNDTSSGVDSDAEGATLTLTEVNGAPWSELTDSSHSDYPAASGWKQLSLNNGIAYFQVDGSMAYVPNENSTETDSFTYRVTDGSLRSNLATVTLAVTNVNDAPTLTLDLASVNVAESNLASGTNAQEDGEFAENYINIADVDGLATIDSITFSNTGTSDVVLQIGNGVGEYATLADMVGASFTTANGTVTLVGYDSGTFSYRFELTSAYHHTSASATNQFTVSVSDGSAAPASATVTININDDQPQIDSTNVLTADTLTVDESTLSTNVTANFADNFASAIQYGADGAGSTQYSLVLGSSNVASGLYALGSNGARGTEIVLNQSGNVITGSVGSTSYFTITVNNTTGDVTFDQLAAIYHGDASNHDDSETLQATAGQFVLRVAVTDSDNDSTSYDLDLGQSSVFQIKDDGIAISSSGSVTAGALQVDESAFSVNAQTNMSALFSVSAGSDGTQSVLYALGIASQGVASGLSDSVTGQAVYLYSESGAIVGRAGNSAGSEVFRMSVNSSGVVSLDQLRSITHPDTTQTNEAVSLASGLLSLTATATDNDGDQASQSIDISSAVRFLDDAPVASSDVVDLPNNGLLVVNRINGVAANDQIGGDNVGTSMVVGVVQGQNSTVNTDNTSTLNRVVAGQYGDLTMSADGSFRYERTDLSAENVDEHFVYTIKDADGDMASAQLTIRIGQSERVVPTPQEPIPTTPTPANRESNSIPPAPTPPAAPSLPLATEPGQEVLKMVNEVRQEVTLRAVDSRLSPTSIGGITDPVMGTGPALHVTYVVADASRQAFIINRVADGLVGSTLSDNGIETTLTDPLALQSNARESTQYANEQEREETEIQQLASTGEVISDVVNTPNDTNSELVTLPEAVVPSPQKSALQNTVEASESSTTGKTSAEEKEAIATASENVDTDKASVPSHPSFAQQLQSAAEKKNGRTTADDINSLFS